VVTNKNSDRSGRKKRAQKMLIHETTY